MMSSVSLLQEGKRINRSLSGGVLYVSKLEVMELLAQLANSFGSDELQVLEAIDVYVERSAKFTSGRVMLCADVFWNCVEDIVKGEIELDRAIALWHADVVIPGKRFVDDLDMLEWCDGKVDLTDSYYSWIGVIAANLNYSWNTIYKFVYGCVVF